MGSFAEFSLINGKKMYVGFKVSFVRCDTSYLAFNIGEQSDEVTS